MNFIIDNIGGPLPWRVRNGEGKVIAMILDEETAGALAKGMSKPEKKVIGEKVAKKVSKRSSEKKK